MASPPRGESRALPIDEPSTPARASTLPMNLSLGELEALCRKAARGAGFDWGVAEEAGRAARQLSASGLRGAELLLARLDDRDGTSAAPLSPRALDGEWRGGDGPLCPILAGAALADAASEIDLSRGVLLHDVLAPLLLLPFAGLAARHVERPVTVAWADIAVSHDGSVLRASGDHRSAFERRVDRVRCRACTEADATRHPPMARTTRATLDPLDLSRLEAYAQRTCAPATEDSRRRGAGGGGGSEIDSG